MTSESLLPWWVVAVAVAMIIIALFMGGCASEPFWHVDRPGYNPPVKTVRLDTAQQLSTACMMPRNAEDACVRRLPSVCLVYLGPKANACAESHEVNGHCKGYNHFLTYGLTQDCAYEL